MNKTKKCADPSAPKEICIICGNSIHTCERKKSANNSYLCPVDSHNNGWELNNGIWVCSKKCETQYFKDLAKKQWFDDIDIKFFNPFNFLIIKKPKINDPNWHPSDDLYQYGFSLDLTTEIYYYTYDWGYGFNFRILGFGFEITKIEK